MSALVQRLLELAFGHATERKSLVCFVVHLPCVKLGPHCSFWKHRSKIASVFDHLNAYGPCLGFDSGVFHM